MGGNHRADVGAGKQWVAAHQFLRQADEVLAKTRVDRRLDQQALSADAVLPRRPEGPGQATVDGGRKVAVRHDDHRRIAAQVHGELLQAGRAGNLLAGDEAASKGNHPHLTAGDQGLAQFRAAGGDGDHRLGQPGLNQIRDQFDGRQRRQLRRFENHRVAAGNGRTELVRHQIQWIVVRGDRDDQAQRLAGEPALARLGALIGIERHHFPGIAPGLFGRKFEGVDAAFELFFRLFEGLAGFVDNQPGKCRGIAFDVQGGLFENACPTMTRQCGAGLRTAATLHQQLRNLRCTNIRYGPDNGPVKGVEDFDVRRHGSQRKTRSFHRRSPSCAQQTDGC